MGKEMDRDRQTETERRRFGVEGEREMVEEMDRETQRQGEGDWG